MCRYGEVRSLPGRASGVVIPLGAPVARSASRSACHTTKANDVRGNSTLDYTSHEMTHLAVLARKILPLGRDEWEYLTNIYNMRKVTVWGKRDFECSRRKFKALHTT